MNPDHFTAVNYRVLCSLCIPLEVCAYISLNYKNNLQTSALLESYPAKVCYFYITNACQLVSPQKVRFFTETKLIYSYIHMSEGMHEEPKLL